jgi:hypothetical protein
MRITIDVQEGQPPRVTQVESEAAAARALAAGLTTGVGATITTNTAEAGTANGGAPTLELFQALGVSAPVSGTYTPASAVALTAPGTGAVNNGGAAPDWVWQGESPPGTSFEHAQGSGAGQTATAGGAAPSGQ